MIYAISHTQKRLQCPGIGFLVDPSSSPIQNIAVKLSSNILTINIDAPNLIPMHDTHFDQNKNYYLAIFCVLYVRAYYWLCMDSMR